jgi:hypothetical protein
MQVRTATITDYQFLSHSQFKFESGNRQFGMVSFLFVENILVLLCGYRCPIMPAIRHHCLNLKFYAPGRL